MSRFWSAPLVLVLVLVALGGLARPVEAQGCERTHFDSSPPALRPFVDRRQGAVTIWADNIWLEHVQPSGSMRPTIQDGSTVILIPPDLRVLIPGRVIVFRHPYLSNQFIIHRIVAEGIDSVIPAQLLGQGPSGWTLAWDREWYMPGATPPTPPLEARYWVTKGDNNCLVDSWQVHYQNIVGVMIGIVE